MNFADPELFLAYGSPLLADVDSAGLASDLAGVDIVFWAFDKPGLQTARDAYELYLRLRDDTVSEVINELLRRRFRWGDSDAELIGILEHKSANARDAAPLPLHSPATALSFFTPQFASVPPKQTLPAVGWKRGADAKRYRSRAGKCA